MMGVMTGRIVPPLKHVGHRRSLERLGTELKRREFRPSPRAEAHRRVPDIASQT